mmetsp:Transcript_33416/g.83791  ORF Transcript_33416/g.83791 Transcript_33416/m.83791 type:complete len:188 (+) Transcript_33416:434-997(+)
MIRLRERHAWPPLNRTQLTPRAPYMAIDGLDSSMRASTRTPPRMLTKGVITTHHEAAEADKGDPQVQDTHRCYPYVVEDRGRRGQSAWTAIYIFTVLSRHRLLSHLPYAAGLRCSAGNSASPFFISSRLLTSTGGTASTPAASSPPADPAWFFPVTCTLSLLRCRDDGARCSAYQLMTSSWLSSSSA